MVTVVIALISFAVAFVAGGVLSKAYFTTQAADDGADHKLAEQRQHYRKRIDALQRIIRRHEESLEQIRQKVHEFQQRAAQRKNAVPPTAKLRIDELGAQLAVSEQEASDLQQEIVSLRETDDTRQQQTESAAEAMNLLRIERDELAARVRRTETERRAKSAPVATRQDDQANIAGSLRAEMGKMREELGQRDRQVRDLQRQLSERDGQINELTLRLESWKQRVAPLTARLKQQRDVIHHYRQARVEPENAVTAGDDAGDDACDDLKSIHGIGPALERRLNRHGIRRFEQIAAMSEPELAKISEQLAIAPNLARRDRWVEQAHELAHDLATS